MEKLLLLDSESSIKPFQRLEMTTLSKIQIKRD